MFKTVLSISWVVVSLMGSDITFAKTEFVPATQELLKMDLGRLDIDSKEIRFPFYDYLDQGQISEKTQIRLLNFLIDSCSLSSDDGQVQVARHCIWEVMKRLAEGITHYSKKLKSPAPDQVLNSTLAVHEQVNLAFKIFDEVTNALAEGKDLKGAQLPKELTLQPYAGNVKRYLEEAQEAQLKNNAAAVKIK